MFRSSTNGEVQSTEAGARRPRVDTAFAFVLTFVVVRLWVLQVVVLLLHHRSGISSNKLVLKLTGLGRGLRARRTKSYLVLGDSEVLNLHWDRGENESGFLIVLKGPVLGTEKRPELDRTRTETDRTFGPSFRFLRIKNR